jgi:hypothetical protein
MLLASAVGISVADEWFDRRLATQTSGSADKFLLLIKCFKSTFLQDAAVMNDIIPNHLIWRHELFRSQLFLDFQR